MPASAPLLAFYTASSNDTIELDGNRSIDATTSQTKLVADEMVQILDAYELSYSVINVIVDCCVRSASAAPPN